MTDEDLDPLANGQGLPFELVFHSNIAVKIAYNLFAILL